MSALDKEVGGSHYKKQAMQPYEYIVKCGLTFTQGNIVKYITRYMDKNGAQDVQKCIHYAQLGREFNDLPKKYDLLGADAYCKINDLDREQTNIILATAMCEYDRVEELCSALLRRKYPDDAVNAN